jgi:hypothetical protein
MKLYTFTELVKHLYYGGAIAENGWPKEKFIKMHRQTSRLILYNGNLRSETKIADEDRLKKKWVISNGK